MINKLKDIEEYLGLNICDLAVLALPVALLSQFVIPSFLPPKVTHFLSGTVTGIAASTASLIYCLLADGDRHSDDEKFILNSQSGRGQPVSRYDRSRYVNNGRPDDSYTAKKAGSAQYKKCYFKDGSVRMVPIGPRAEKTAINPQPSTEATPSFSGISMSASEITRDLTTEKDFVQRENEKKELQTAKPSSIAMQDEPADSGGGDVGW